MSLLPTLTADELERYARHIVLRDIGGPGQQKLKAARVLVIGAGGLGAPLLQYLAAAGVSTIGLVDDDTVSLSNLQRQVIHSTADIGRAKTASAEDAIARINPHVTVEAHATRITAANAARSSWRRNSQYATPSVETRLMTAEMIDTVNATSATAGCP